MKFEEPIYFIIAPNSAKRRSCLIPLDLD